MLRLSGSFLSPLALFLVSSVVCVALVAETTLVSGRFVGGFTHATTCDRLPESLYRFHQVVVSGNAMFHGEDCILTRKKKRNGTSSQNGHGMQRKAIIGSTRWFQHDRFRSLGPVPLPE